MVSSLKQKNSTKETYKVLLAFQLKFTVLGVFSNNPDGFWLRTGTKYQNGLLSEAESSTIKIAINFYKEFGDLEKKEKQLMPITQNPTGPVEKEYTKITRRRKRNNILASI